MAAPAVRVLEHELLVYRRSWRGSIFSSFLNPVLFLAAMGLGLGSLVDASAQAGTSTPGANAAALAGVSYLAFLAPGLLASTAMQTAAGESTFPVMAGLVWIKSFHGMTATPIRPSDVVVGKLTYIGIRLVLVLSVFFGVTVLFGAVAGPESILAIPAAVLTGLAFAAPIAAYSATQKDANGFNALFRFGVIPLFLFSGTFFPISQLPEHPAGRGRADPALARRRPVPVAGPRLRGAAADGDPPRLPRHDGHGGGRGGPHHVPAAAGEVRTGR